MDATYGAAAPALNRISRGIREYSLFQGVLLVMDRLKAAHPDLDEEALYEHLEFQANPSLGFPGSDVDRVHFFEEHGQLRAQLRINLVSLFGAGSPLPAFYGEQALGDSAEGNPTREFLDLFNNHLQRLMLPIWQKYRYRARFTSGARDPLSEQQNRLGRANSQLGESLVLGERVRDRGGKFRIHIRQLSWDRFHEFLPVGTGYQPLCALVRFTLRDPLDYDIRLQLRQDDIRDLRIGAKNTCRLGWTSWLGSERADGIVTLCGQIH